MPYASKGQLYSLLRRQVRFDQRTAAQYMREVLEAVRYIHSFSPKIIHRDIKPENLLLDENYRVLLSDFGWSNFLDENESRKTFCGTPEYLSPEMAKKSGHNEMVDIWALGVLLFEFLAGYAPFSGSCPKELYTNIKKLKVNWPVDFPPLAKNLVSKILKLNPSERLSVEEILDHSWFTQNPPLRHVLTNYLTDEKDILKSHLIIATPESVEDKINDITDPHKKRKFGTLKIKYNDEDSNDINSNSDNNIISIKDNVDDNKENEQNKINENKQDNNDIITRMYMSNIHENYIFLKKEKKELQKKYDELVIKEQKENDLIKILDEENKKLKNKKENLKNSHLMIINEEIKKYKLLSEDREKILNELDEVNNKNSELYLQNELLQNTITLMKKEQEELNNKIINLTKENNDYLSQIEELTKKLEELGSNNNSSGITLNFEDQNKLANQLNEMTEQNMKKLNEYISPINLNFINLEKKVEDLINDKVLSLVDSKIKTFDDLLNEKNDKNNSDIYFEENKKLIEELKESKNKISVNNNNDDKFNDLKNKNNILEERIKTLMEEKKVSDELNESKNKELEKAKTTIKNLNDKIYDINSYINSNCKNESFKKKLCTICQLDDFK
jgi:serine/threonine protein kinase